MSAGEGLAEAGGLREPNHGAEGCDLMFRKTRQASRPRRVTVGTIMIVAGAVVTLTPLGISAYGEISWRWEMKQYAAAPNPLLLTPVGQTPPAPEAETVAPPPEAPEESEGPPTGGRLQVLSFDRRKELPTYQIEIPKLGMKYMVGEGIDNPVLAKGPGHYPQTALPGELGNAALAGHRTVRGRPAFFYRLNELQLGDEIRIGYQDRTLSFAVEKVYLTTPYDLAVLSPTATPSLTLTTCDPPGSDEQRLIVTARLIGVTERQPE
jgi:LPXTG-site transpeptidase (sortase) family protein